MGNYILPRGIVRACAGIAESVDAEPYASYVAAAAAIIGASYGDSPSAQHKRRQLAEAVRLNLINRREYPYELLVRRFELAVSLSTFKREKYKYCYELARLCGFIGTQT